MVLFHHEILEEEKNCATAFGREYAEYMARVKRYFLLLGMNRAVRQLPELRDIQIYRYITVYSCLPARLRISLTRQQRNEWGHHIDLNEL